MIDEAAISTAISNLEATVNAETDPSKVDPVKVKKDYNDGLAKIIADAIKSAKATIPSGAVGVGTSPSVVPNPAPIPLDIA